MLEAFCRWMNVLRFEPEFGFKFFLVYCIALRKFIFMLKFNKLLWYSLPYICSLKEMEKGITKMVKYGIYKNKNVSKFSYGNLKKKKNWKIVFYSTPCESEMFNLNPWALIPGNTFFSSDFLFHVNYLMASVQKQPPEVFCEKAAFKNFVNIHRKFLCWSLFLIKFQSSGLQLY